MTSNPKISVIMPNYNAGPYLEDAIRSILDQTFEDFEFIIVDDHSTDSSRDIIQNYAKQDSRIVAHRNEKNLKICHTLNKGLSIANGKYIARMDSDDIAKNKWLEVIYNFMEEDKNKYIGVCGSNFDIINNQGEVIGSKKFPETDDQCRRNIWTRNPFGHNTVLIRKQCFDEFGGYDPDYVYAEDLDLWVRIGTVWKFHNIQQYLIQYRIGGENSILKKQKQMIDASLRVRKKAIKLGYNINMTGKFMIVITGVMKLLPSKLVLKIFNLFIG